MKKGEICQKTEKAHPCSEDLDEVIHNEPPHLDLHWLPSNLLILNMI